MPSNAVPDRAPDRAPDRGPKRAGATGRLLTLDAIRGLAVMGILLANLPAFGLPESAYFSPAAWGGAHGADRIAWFATFVLVEGKMRGAFSLLFGASLLLVVERARAAGENAAAIHYSRMAWLFAFGCAHLYLLWWGDILAHYALIGALAYPFTRVPVRWLLLAGALLIAWQSVAGLGLALAAFAAHAQDTPRNVALWQSLANGFGIPPAATLAAEIAANRGSYATGLAWRWREAMTPLAFAAYAWADTLALMLFGMAALKSGLLTGGWPPARLRRWAAAALVIALPVYAGLGAMTVAHGFDQRYVILASMAATVPFRPVMTVGYLALATILLRPGGWVTDQLAAAGRMAFTNYLATSLAMGAVFAGWGLGWFGQLSRAQLYLLVPPVWAAMLAGSTWWLTRYRYGPLEWFWRSLARRAAPPLRR